MFYMHGLTTRYWHILRSLLWGRGCVLNVVYPSWSRIPLFRYSSFTPLDETTWPCREELYLFYSMILYRNKEHLVELNKHCKQGHESSWVIFTNQDFLISKKEFKVQKGNGIACTCHGRRISLSKVYKLPFRGSSDL